MSSLSLLLQLIDQLPVPLSVRNRQGNILGSNPTWREQVQAYNCQFSYTQLTGAWSDLELVLARPTAEQEADRLKSEFLACIDHELKTPLTSVIGIASLLNQQTLGELNQKQSRYVQLIHQSGRHLMEIINMMLDLVQAEAGKLVLELEPVDILAVCTASIKHTQRWLEQEAWLNKRSIAPIRLELDIAAGLTMCIADSRRLQQMLYNLLSNACKFSYSPDQEPYPVAVHLEVRCWGAWLAFTVRDQGVGIPNAQQHLIFQRFHQLDNTLVRQYGGTGLGLVLTRQLARLHGGDVTFTSQVGVGSQFTILLPYDSAPAASPLVLVATDDPQEIVALSARLEAIDCHVVIARTAMEAIEKIRQLHPVASIIKANLPLLSTVHLAEHAMLLYSHPDQVTPQQVHSLISHHKPATLLYVSNTLTPETLSALAQAGYRLVEAHDTRQARVLARIWHPDLLLVPDICPTTSPDLPCVVIPPHSSLIAVLEAIKGNTTPA